MEKLSWVIFLADVLKKTSTSMFLTMFEKTKTSCSRCILTMFFKPLENTKKNSNTTSRVNIQNLNSIFEAWIKLSRVTFLAE